MVNFFKRIYVSFCFTDKPGPNVLVMDKIILFILSISSIILALTIGVTLLIKPCFPPYFGSIILNCESNGTIAWTILQYTAVDITLKCILALIGAWFNALGASTVMLQLSTLYVTTECLNSYLNQLYQLV